MQLRLLYRIPRYFTINPSMFKFLELLNSNEKRDNKQCLFDTPPPPCRVTVNSKRLVSKHKKQRKNMHIHKSHGIIKNYKGKSLLIALAPSSSFFIIYIILEDRNVFARFDEIPSLTLKDIKETVYIKAIKNYKEK